jgi:hypothetical protein
VCGERIRRDELAPEQAVQLPARIAGADCAIGRDRETVIVPLTPIVASSSKTTGFSKPASVAIEYANFFPRGETMASDRMSSLPAPRARIVCEPIRPRIPGPATIVSVSSVADLRGAAGPVGAARPARSPAAVRASVCCDIRVTGITAPARIPCKSRQENFLMAAMC